MEESDILDAPLIPNARVQWKYRHWLNSSSFTWVYKNGTVIRQIRERSGFQRPTKYYLVLFDGNKRPSKVHEKELKKHPIKTNKK